MSVFSHEKEPKMNIFEKLNEIKFRTETIRAPELGSGFEIIIRELSAGQHAEFIDRLKNEEFRNSERKLTAFMIFNCLVDENGNRQIQTEDQAQELIDRIPQSLIRRINAALTRLNNVDDDDGKEKKRK